MDWQDYLLKRVFAHMVTQQLCDHLSLAINSNNNKNMMCLYECITDLKTFMEFLINVKDVYVFFILFILYRKFSTIHRIAQRNKLEKSISKCLYERFFYAMYLSENVSQ